MCNLCVCAVAILAADTVLVCLYHPPVSIMMKSAPVSVRHGAFVFHVDDVTTLSYVMRVCKASEHTGCEDRFMHALATVSSTAIARVAKAHPESRVRSVRDVAFLLKGQLASDDRKLLAQINDAYAFARHMSPQEL